ncbi:MAG TPA: hypothetical protein VID94_08370 [Acidimicrobiales bacterium]|jgi:hypothetical protein
MTYAHCLICDRDWLVEPDATPETERCTTCGHCPEIFGHPSLLEGE